MACDVEYALQENLNMISGAEPFRCHAIFVGSFYEPYYMEIYTLNLWQSKIIHRPSPIQDIFIDSGA